MFNPTFPSNSPRAPPIHTPLPDPFTHQDPFLPSAKRHRRSSIGRSENEEAARLQNDNRSVVWNTTISDHRRQQSAPLNGPSSTQAQYIPTSDSPASVNEIGRRRSISEMIHVDNNGPLDPPSYYPAYSQNKMSPPSPQQLSKSYAAAELNRDTASNYTNGHKSGSGKLSARPAGSMPISSLIGTDDLPSKPQSQCLNPQQRHSTSNMPASSREYVHPYSPSISSPPTRPDSIQNRRPYTPEAINSDFAIGSGRKQPQSANPLVSTNFYGHMSPTNRAESSGLGKQLYSPSAPNASAQPQFDKSNTDEAFHCKAPISSRPKSQPTQSPFSYSARGARILGDLKQAKEGHTSQIQGYKRHKVGLMLENKNGNGLEVIDSQPRAVLNPPDDQRHEIRSLPKDQGNDVDNWRRSSTARDYGVNSSSRTLPSEKMEPTHIQPVRYNILDSTSIGYNAGDSKDSLRRERIDVDDRFQTPLNNSNNYRKRSETAWSSVNSVQENQKFRSMFADGSSRRMEELPHHKVLAGITSENNKKPGRASPLPQAVQGAQAQPAGPGGNPDIKNEFGRMFSGLGSGLSSAPPNNGITTPSRLSPLPRRPHDGVESAPPHSNVNIESLKLTRTGSFPGRKFRRIKEDGSHPSDGGADGHSTPFATLEQSSKRSKHAHSSHHHHHPPIGHHHHHHHNMMDEGAQSTALKISPGNAKYPATKFHLGNVSDNYDNPPLNHRHHHHHHHHHAHLPHHHHIQGRQGPMALEETLQVPNVTVLSQEIHDSIKHLPRRHLGSQLYRPIVSRAPSATTQLDTKFGYRSRFKSLPLFEGKANCTFTVRVPSYYLTCEQRELISLDRNLYGTDIYTDDSDPVAAAIHCGWIRGEWPEEVDVSLLQTASSVEKERSHTGFLDDEMDDQNQLSIMNVLPHYGPVRPKPYMDLHITLRVLPPLQRYASSVRHGLKSRSWGSNHDGMSFEIIKLEWVNEGIGSRGEERTGAARRKRLRTAMSFMGKEERGQKGLVGAAA